ncbi:MAG: hypothetical protein ACKO4L_18630 [Nodosilinea sp.]
MGYRQLWWASAIATLLLSLLPQATLINSRSLACEPTPPSPSPGPVNPQTPPG